MIRWLVAIACGAATLGGSATAGGAATRPPGYWTPREAARVLLLPDAKVAWIERKELGPALRYPIGKFGVAARLRKVACRGTERPRAGAYPAFRCTLTFSKGTTAVYARIWSAGAACVSPITLADCPPPVLARPLPGDPRCSISSTICMARTARARTLAALRAAKTPVQTAGCFALTAFHYSCIWHRGGRAALVYFVRGKSRWTIAVHIAPPPQG